MERPKGDGEAGVKGGRDGRKREIQLQGRNGRDADPGRTKGGGEDDVIDIVKTGGVEGCQSGRRERRAVPVEVAGDGFVENGDTTQSPMSQC